MSFKSLLFKLTGLLLTLWGTASALFFLSLLLPSVNSPLGMNNSDTTVYGSASKDIQQQVVRDYRLRKGLDKPVFYLKIQPYGWTAAKASKQPSSLSLFQKQATLCHGLTPTEAFLKELKIIAQDLSKTPTGSVMVLDLYATLDEWAIEIDKKKKGILENQFLLSLEKTGQKRFPLVFSAWQDLLASSAPAWHYLPIVEWAGLNNQYHIWVSGLLKGDLGISSKDYRPVLDKTIESLRVSATVGIPGLGFALLFSCLMGFWLSLPNDIFLKNSLKQGLYIIDSLPGFMITLGIFALYLYLGGNFSSVNTEDATNFSNTTLLGSICVAWFLLPYLTLFFYQNLQQEENKQYLRTARAKGLSVSKAMVIHGVPNALAISIVIVADILASLIAGILIVEIIFSLPGSGSLLAQSLLSQDFPTVIGLTLCLLFLRTLVMWSADIINGLLDPRMRVI